MTPDESMRDAAISYARSGLPVFPCREKKPLTPHGFKDASADVNQIEAWWGMWPDAQIACPTGGILSLDLDTPHAALRLEELEAEHGALPETRHVRTSPGRRQIHFRVADGITTKSLTNFLGVVGFDVRGTGGYTVLPPSIHHKSGEPYQVVINAPLAEAPSWLLKLIQEWRPAPIPASSNGDGEKIHEPGRNATLARMAGAMRNKGMAEPAILAALLAVNREQCDPPLAEREVTAIAKSYARYEPGMGEVKVTATKATANDSITRIFAGVEREPLRWLWPGRIPLGKLTLIIGDPGLGKSLLTVDLAARVSCGADFNDNAPCEAGNVILLSAEDDAADTIRPRLDAAGADVSRVISMDAVRVYLADGTPTEKLFNLETDMAVLEGTIRKFPGTRLVVIDPLSAYLGGVDSHSNAEVRGMLRPLSDLAARCGIAVMGITHLSKARQSAVRSAIGSIAFAAAARAVWAVAGDTADPERRLFLPVKQNLAANVGGLSFTVEALGGIPRLHWEPGTVDVDANAALGEPERQEDASARTEAESWLRDLLAETPVPVKTIKGEANGAGLAWRTVERAKHALGVVAEKDGFGGAGGWSWKLPDGTGGAF